MTKRNLIIIFLGLTLLMVVVIMSSGPNQMKIRTESISKICVDGLVVYSTKEGIMYQRTIDDKLVECGK